MDIFEANAEYTGGGIYAYIGKLTNGNYFMAADDWNSNDGCYVYEVNSKVVFDSFDDNNPAPWDNDWIDSHLVKTYYTDAFKEILKWIVNNEPNGNYNKEELEKRLKGIC